MVETYYIKGIQKQPFEDVLQNRCFAEFTGKHQCWSHFLIKLHTCFPMIFVEFSRTTIF